MSRQKVEYMYNGILFNLRKVLKKSKTWMKFEDIIVKEISQNDQYFII